MRFFSLPRATSALLLASSIWLTVACENRPTAATATPSVPVPIDSTTPVVALAYICPMGCEGSPSSQPGKCPVCEMTLESNPDYKPALQ